MHAFFVMHSNDITLICYGIGRIKSLGDETVRFVSAEEENLFILYLSPEVSL